VDVRYDSHGSMLNLANTPEAYGLRWDYRDMIHRVNLGGGGMAFYSYDAGKQRNRKRIEHNGNRVEERLYLGGMEVYRRWLNGSLVEEIETHHLFAGEQRLLIVEDVQLTDNPNLNAGLLHRYQYGNHLGSVSLELTGDDDSQVISYEEYHPYGTTAYRARNAALNATAKRYRYTGMERDEETGLSYHTARYYLPWLGRWGSVDPIGIKGNINHYEYSSLNPVSNYDKNGEQATPAPVAQQQPTQSPNGDQALWLENQWQGRVTERSTAGSLSRAASGRNRFTTQVLLEFEITSGGVTRSHRIRADFLLRIGNDDSSRFLMLDAKASRDAGLTENERLVYAQLYRAMNRGDSIRATVIARSSRTARRAARIGLADGSQIQVEGLQISDPSNRQTVIQNVRSAIQGRPGWRRAATSELRASLHARQLRLTRSRTGPLVRSSRPRLASPGTSQQEGSQPSSPMANPVFQVVFEDFAEFVFGGIGIDPDSRLRNCDVHRCTLDDIRRAQRRRALRQYAESGGISEREADEFVRSHRHSSAEGDSSRYPAIGPDPNVGQARERSWEAFGWDLFGAIIGDRESFNRLMF
jgi:RHS repeat-associated protein